MTGDDISHGCYRGSWFTWSRSPPAPLAGLVDYHGFVLDAGRPMTDLCLPGPRLTVVLSFGDEVRLEQHIPGSAEGGRFVSFVAGLHDGHSVIGHDGHQAGVQVDLDPLVARALFDGAVGELASDVVAVNTVLGRSGDLLAERLAEASGWPARFAVLDTLLARRLERAQRPRPELVHAWRLLRQRHGAVRVDTLAREVGWSRRHLTASFRREIGLAPKAAARVARFDRARWQLALGRAGSLTDLALRCGYYDHAHLDREFRALAGRPPSRLGDTALVPFVQDGPAVPA